MVEGAPAENRDAAESDRLAGLSRRLSAVESKFGDSSSSEKKPAAFSLAWLLVPVLLIVAAVGAFFVHKRKPAPEEK